MRKFLALGLLMALLIGTASAALFESGTKDAQPTVLYGKYNNTIVPIKVAADGSVGAGGGVAGSDTQVQFNDGGAMAGDAGLTYNKTTDVLTAGSYATAATTDPYTTYDVSTAGDMDAWIGISSDNNGDGTGDALGIGLGLTPFTGNIFTLQNTGTSEYITLGGGTLSNQYITYSTAATTDFQQVILGTSGVVRVSLNNLAQTASSGSTTLYSINGTYSGAQTSAGNQNVNFQSNMTNTSTNTVGYSAAIRGYSQMKNTSGTQTDVYGVMAIGDRNGTGGTTTSFHALYGVAATVTAGTLTNNYAAGFDGKTRIVPYPLTIADSGDGNAATSTPAISSSIIQLTCSDTDGCTITLSETGVLDGTRLSITNVSANVCNFADTAGVTEIAGAFAMGQYDTLVLEYVVNTWVEISRSNN